MMLQGIGFLSIIVYLVVIPWLAMRSDIHPYQFAPDGVPSTTLLFGMPAKAAAVSATQSLIVLMLQSSWCFSRQARQGLIVRVIYSYETYFREITKLGRLQILSGSTPMAFLD